MRKRWILFMLALLLLCGCTTKQTPKQTEPQETQNIQNTQNQTQENLLLGTWINTGTYENGSQYEEILTVFDNGTVSVVLNYKGSYYTTLTGSYVLASNCFSVTIDSVEEPFTTDYHYEVDGRQLTLTDFKGTYTYLRG